MSSTSILGVIQHYQRSIEHSQDNESRLLHCINKLYKLPVKVEHLQETGVGKTVNSLRKYNGEIGIAAKALVTKWKAMVTAAEEPAEVNNCNANDDDDMNNANGHGSSDDDRPNHSEEKTSPQERTNSNTLNESASKDRQNKDRDKSNSEHKSKSHSESKTHKTHEHSTKGKRDVEQEEKVKKSKHEDRRSEGRNRENDRHKSSEEKSTRHREHGEKEISNRDAKTTSSSTTHHKNGGDSKEKKENLKSVKSSEHSSSSKRETNSSSEKTNKHGDSEKHRSPKDKDRHERSKENKHDKSKSSSKDTSHRDKHNHHHSTSHSSSGSSKPTRSTNEQAASSSTHTKDESKNSSRKRQHDSDSNDSIPTKAKVSKTPKDNKQKDSANDNSDEVDADDGIDSSMGANFADVLGMLNMPTKKFKKSLSTNKSPTVSTSSRSTSNEKARSSSSSSKTAKIEYKPSPISSASTSTKAIDTKPDLLSASASAKLAPLDPSIALELPTISANYKPLPHNKTVMDCIYRNSGGVLSTPKPVRTLTDAEALSHGISSKTMRTKIYSGVKTGQILQVPSLFDLCIRVLQKNIDGLEYTGGVPFDVLRPVLDRATPQQLLTFEEYNPYLMEDSDCLWQIHVQRNYRNKKRMEMESWREMFLRCEEEKEQKLNSLTETIKQSQKVIAAPVRKTQLAFVDSMVKPPRNVMRKQEQFGTKAKLVATPAARVAALSNVTPNAGKVGDTRLRVAATVRDAAQVSHTPVRAKKAPLMAKTLQFMRGRHKR